MLPPLGRQWEKPTIPSYKSNFKLSMKTITDDTSYRKILFTLAVASGMSTSLCSANNLIREVIPGDPHEAWKLLGGCPIILIILIQQQSDENNNILNIENALSCFRRSQEVTLQKRVGALHLWSIQAVLLASRLSLKICTLRLVVRKQVLGFTTAVLCRWSGTCMNNLAPYICMYSIKVENVGSPLKKLLARDETASNVAKPTE